MASRALMCLRLAPRFPTDLSSRLQDEALAGKSCDDHVDKDRKPPPCNYALHLAPVYAGVVHLLNEAVNAHLAGALAASVFTCRTNVEHFSRLPTSRTEYRMRPLRRHWKRDRLGTAGSRSPMDAQ